MGELNGKVVLEIRDMLKLLAEEQKQLADDIRELKVEQKKIQEELKMNNFVLNNMNPRSEIVN